MDRRSQPSLPSPRRDGLDIDDETGIVVSGAWEERTAHVLLDVAEILLRFLGIWSVTPENRGTVANLSNQVTHTENGVVILRKEGIVSKSGHLCVTRAYVHAPPGMTPATMEKDRTVLLHARRFEREGEMPILVEVGGKPGSPAAFQMLHPDDDILRIAERLPRTAWKRCAPQRRRCDPHPGSTEAE